MSIKTEKFDKRLDKIESVLRPAGSLKAKIESLSVSHFEAYNAWKERSEQCYLSYKGNAYEALLDMQEGKNTDFKPPVLPSYISNQLYPPMRYTDNAREDYQRLLEEV